MEPDWSQRRLHFVGVGGAGMSGLALIAQALGAQVTGSDRAESAYTARLREHGIEPVIGHAATNLPADALLPIRPALPDPNFVAQRIGLCHKPPHADAPLHWPSRVHSQVMR